VRADGSSAELTAKPARWPAACPPGFAGDPSCLVVGGILCARKFKRRLQEISDPPILPATGSRSTVAAVHSRLGGQHLTCQADVVLESTTSALRPRRVTSFTSFFAFVAPNLIEVEISLLPRDYHAQLTVDLRLDGPAA
jgi:hypothetical protein